MNDEPDVFRTCCESTTFMPHQSWCVAYMPPQIAPPPSPADVWAEAIHHVEPFLAPDIKRAAMADNPYRETR